MKDTYDNPLNKHTAYPREADFGQFLVNIWKADALRPEIYSVTPSCGPFWMRQLEAHLSERERDMERERKREEAKEKEDSKK